MQNLTDDLVERGAIALAGYTMSGQFGVKEWPKGYSNPQKASCRNRARAVLEATLKE